MDRNIDILLGHFNLDSPKDFYDSMKKYIDQNIKKCIITANPEVVMMALNNAQMKDVFVSKDTIVIPDGIGVVSALRKKYPYKNICRNTGIDLTLFLLEYANEKRLNVGIYGAHENVLRDFLCKYTEEYPNIKFVTYLNGYRYSNEYASEQFAHADADIILIALGTPKQELFISRVMKNVDKGIFVGIGGSLDVLSGHKKRAPYLWIKFNLEWLYRIISEPRRLKRFIQNNVLFMIKSIF